MRLWFWINQAISSYFYVSGRSTIRKSELFHPVRSQPKMGVVNRGETTELCRLDLMAFLGPFFGSVLSNFRTAHSQAADPTENVLSMVATCCYRVAILQKSDWGLRDANVLQQDPQSTWFQTAIRLSQSSCHRHVMRKKKASGVKMVENFVLQRKWLSQVLQRWPIATWGFGKCLPSPQNVWPIPCHMFRIQQATIRKNSWKPWNEVKKSHMYHPVN